LAFTLKRALVAKATLEDGERARKAKGYERGERRKVARGREKRGESRGERGEVRGTRRERRG
jgi:hypothetical protein